MPKDFCKICSRFCYCALIGIYPYCEACIEMRLHDPDGKENFQKLIDESGGIQFESQ